MTTIINFYAGPSVGKSVAAADVFAHLKKLGENAELVQEYIKQWAWEDRTPVTNDQFYIFGKQARREYTLHNRADFIVTDAPLAICVYYAHVYGSPEFSQVFQDMYKLFRKQAEANGIKYVDVFLRRTKPYQSSGRFQTEQEATQIDKDLKRFLEIDLGIKLIESDPDSVVGDVKGLIE